MADLFDEYDIELTTPEVPQEPTGDLFDKYNVQLEDSPVKAPSTATPVSQLPTDSQQLLQEQVNTSTELAKAMYSEEEIEAIKAKGKIGFFEAKDFLDFQDVAPGGGVWQAVDSARLLNAANKLKNGEETSIGEDELIRKFVSEQIEKDLRGFSGWGGFAYGISQVPAFMIEFAATGGVGKAAQEGVEAAAKKGIQKVVKKQVTKSVVAKTAGVVANVGARAAVLAPINATAKYGELRVNNNIALTDKGSVVFKEGDESPAKSALKATAYHTIDIGSELSGAALTKYAVKPLANVLKTPVVSGVQKLPGKLRHALYTAYKGVNENATVSKVFSATGWNGMLEELGEERVADIMKATFDLSTEDDYGFDDFGNAITPSWQQLLTEAGIVTTLGSVKGSANAVVNILQSRGHTLEASQEISDNMTETERGNMINETIQENITSEDAQLELPLGLETPEQAPPIDDSQSTWKGLYREWSDDLNALEDLQATVEERGGDTSGNSRFTEAARIYKGVMSTIRANLEYGTTKINQSTGALEWSGKGLKQILNDFDAITMTTVTDVNERRKNLNDYGTAMSILDDVEISKTDDSVSISPEQKAQAEATLEALEAKYGEEFVFLQEMGVELTQYATRVSQNLVDTGLMSQEDLDALVAKRPNYLPLNRIFDDAEGISETLGGSPLFSEVDSTIRKRKGSDREIRDINLSLMDYTARILDASLRNRVGQQMAQFAEFVPEHIQEVKQQGRDTVTVKVNGETKHYKVSKPIRKALEGMTPTQLNGLQKLAAGLTNLLKATVTTYNPDFLLRNAPRDVMGAAITSQGKFTPIDFVKGVFAQLSNNQTYKDFLKDGGAFSGFMELSDNGMAKALKRMHTGKTGLFTSANPLRIMEDLNTLVEQAPRVGIYGKLTEQGQDGLTAALYARDITLDFSRGGTKGREANRYWAFLNAGIQGTDKLRRALRDHPKETIGYGLATVTLPSVLLTGFYLYGADEETRMEYMEIPQWERDLFWVWKTDSGWHRFPKPFSFGFIFGSLPERLMMAAYNGEDKLAKNNTQKFWTDLAIGTVGSVSPVYPDEGSILPTAIKPLLEVWANKNTFTDGDIVPQWLTDIDASQQSKSYTSSTLKDFTSLLSEQAGVEISPAQLEHLIQGYTGSVGKNVLDVSDMFLKTMKEASGTEVPTSPVTPSDIPVVRAFSVREPVGSSSQSFTDFYDTFTSLKQTNTTANTIKREQGFEAYKEYREKHEEDIRLYEQVDKRFDKQLRKLNKESREVWKDMDMSSEEKVKELSKIGEDATSLTREANQYIKDNKEK